LVRFLSERKQSVLICSKKFVEIESERFGDFLSLKTKPKRNRINLLSHRNVSIYLGFRGNKTELLRTISNFFTSLERFCLLQATQEQNITFLFSKKMVSKRNQNVSIAPGLVKDRTKLLVPYKKFWKRTRTKAFGQKFSST
jgi:hypothetical protein